MEDKIKILKIIHFAIVLGVVFASVFAGEIYSLSNLSVPDFNTTNLIYFAIPFLAVFLSNFLFRKSIQTISSANSIAKKMAIYQFASIIRWAIIEATIFLLIFGFPDFKVLGVLLILYLILIRPTNQSVYSELNI